MTAATVTWPPIQMHAATMCTQRTKTGAETLSMPVTAKKAPGRQRLLLDGWHDAIEIERAD